MSECVVRMERVPKNCDDGCWGSLSGECPWCDSIDGYKMVGNRPPNCPILCQLPEGHGRLIDADVILQYLREKTAMFDADDGKIELVSLTIRNDLQGFIKTILETPTIVPAERRET